MTHLFSPADSPHPDLSPHTARVRRRAAGYAALCCLGVAASVWLSSAQGQDSTVAPPQIFSHPFIFRDTTAEAGLIDGLAGMMAHCAAWGDFDGDGLIDLYVGGFCDRPDNDYRPAPGPVSNRLFRNLNNGRFVRIERPEVQVRGRTAAAVFADFRNNARLDLYLANNAMVRPTATEGPQRSAQALHSQLFRNDGETFSDVSLASNASPPELYSARNVGVFDFDNDGLLDLLVIEDRYTDRPRSRLLRNRGNLLFEDVTAAVGLPDNLFGLGLAVGDVNGDGFPDFFVADSNRLFLSQNGPTYREAIELREVFAWRPLNNEDRPCGAVFADLNRDGYLDLIVTAYGNPARNRVFLNYGPRNGVPDFRDVTRAVGLGDAVPAKCAHVEVQDFDNDGFPDIYMSVGWQAADGRLTPLVYRHLGIRDGLPRFAPPRPLTGPMVSFLAGPSCDYDRDGRRDLFLVSGLPTNSSRLLHNESPTRHWLDVQVRGRRVNRMGIGTQVSIFSPGQLNQPGGLLGLQEINISSGFGSSPVALVHFGLGDYATVDVRVAFPNGRVVTRTGVLADQALTVDEVFAAPLP